MDREETLRTINKIIKSENGMPLRPGDKFPAAELDSLGIMIVLLTITAEFGIDPKVIDNLDIRQLTVEDLLDQCESLSTNT